MISTQMISTLQATCVTPPGRNQPPVASAEQIHGHLVASFRIGNRARLRFARLLHAVHVQRLYLELGHPNITHYAEHCFRLGRSETHERLRVAAAVASLPELRTAFERGDLSWSALKAVTRVATAETDGEWLAFAREHTVAKLNAEVAAAREQNRDRPRTDRFGLPNVRSRMVIDLTTEERVRLDAALEHAAGEIEDRMGDAPLSIADVFLYMAERFLRTDARGTPEGRTERSDSPHVIVYHQCETCRRARVVAPEGAVEVDPECVERRRGAAAEERLVEDDAAEIAAGEIDSGQGEAVIDRPNPATLARRVKLRDGCRCSNPGCGSRDHLHAHHIVFRAHGGRTVAANEVTVCARCHALIHAGLLTVTGTPAAGIRWQPRSSGLEVDARPDAQALAEVPVVTVESARADSAVGSEKNGRSKVAAELDAAELDALARGLADLGMPRHAARQQLEHARREMKAQGEPFDENELIRRALSR